MPLERASAQRNYISSVGRTPLCRGPLELRAALVNVIFRFGTVDIKIAAVGLDF